MDSISPRHHQDNNRNPIPNQSLLSSSSNTNGLSPSPRPVTRSESGSPYPTTFVQADTTSFKQVVQMLTGSSDAAGKAVPSPSSAPPKPDSRIHIPPIKSIPKKNHQQSSGFKLYERRNSLKNLHINPLIPSPVTGFSPRKPEILSPSILDFPSLALSPVTPLLPDPFCRLDTEAEDRAIKEKGFFLHPSPATTPRDAQPPRLLPLFPTTSPRASGSSCSSASS